MVTHLPISDTLCCLQILGQSDETSPITDFRISLHAAELEGEHGKSNLSFKDVPSTLQFLIPIFGITVFKVVSSPTGLPYFVWKWLAFWLSATFSCLHSLGYSSYQCLNYFPDFKLLSLFVLVSLKKCHCFVKIQEKLQRDICIQSALFNQKPWCIPK